MTTVNGAPAGKLAGKKVVRKDNVRLAGVPMMNGASTLEGNMPDIDATIVAGILDAGGTIVGKAHCEPLHLWPEHDLFVNRPPLFRIML